MAAEREGWIGRLREVGLAFGSLVAAELSALADDLGRSGAAFARALVLAAVAAGVAFWTLGLFLYFAIELLALAMPRWGAVGVVFALFLIVGAALIVVVEPTIAVTVNGVAWVMLANDSVKPEGLEVICTAVVTGCSSTAVELLRLPESTAVSRTSRKAGYSWSGATKEVSACPSISWMT